MVDEPKITLKVKLDNIFQMISNKVTSWSQTPSNDKYPSEKLVKDSLDEKISKSNISGLIKNDGTVDTNIYISASDECGTFTELKTLINNAQTGDTIVLEKDYKNTGNEDFPRIDKVIKIIGNGHIIDGNNVNRIFNVNVDGITFENIVFINGSNNALYGRKMNIFDCVFINNFEYYDGGAVCCNYDVNIVNSTFINNKVETDDWMSRGGAIWIDGNNSVIQDCLFIGNSASATGYDGLGGAIYIDGNQSQSKILDCTFIDNSASSNGGGIYSSTQNFKVYNCTFKNSSLYNTTNVNYLTEHQDISGKENISNKTNDITSSSTNTQYPSAKGVYDLVSALSGGGISDFYIDTETDEIVIEADGSGGGGSGSVDIVTDWEQTLSDGKVPSEKLTKLSIDDKADINHTHTKNQITDFPTIPSKTSDLQNDSGFLTEHQSIKTVDGNSLIGTGNIVINYNDLSNKPTIPTDVSDLTDTQNTQFTPKSHNHTKSQITDFPTIPSKVSDLNNDSGFITSSAISDMVTTSDIANDLNTTTSGKVLDARQGKVLNDLIGQAITYINQ